MMCVKRHTRGTSSSLMSSSLTCFVGKESRFVGDESRLLGDLLGDLLSDLSRTGDLTGELGSVLTFTFSSFNLSASSLDFSLCLCSEEDEELCFELLPSLCLWLLDDELCLWLLDDELCLLEPSL